MDDLDGVAALTADLTGAPEGLGGRSCIAGSRVRADDENVERRAGRSDFAKVAFDRCDLRQLPFDIAVFTGGQASGENDHDDPGDQRNPPSPSLLPAPPFPVPSRGRSCDFVSEFLQSLERI